jgi:hypothetical protein
VHDFLIPLMATFSRAIGPYSAREEHTVGRYVRVTNFHGSSTEQVGLVVTFHTCIWVVLGSNLF